MVETERLILRPFSSNDIEEYSRIVDDPDIHTYVPYANKESINELIDAYSKGDFKNDFYFVIEEKSSGNIVGSILAIRIKSCLLDVCYLIGRQYRNKGYMSEALLGFVHYIANDIDTYYYALQLTVENSNVASRRVLEKCGGEPWDNFSLTDPALWYIKLD